MIPGNRRARRVVLEGDVQVGERHAEAHDLAGPLREDHEVGDYDRLQLLREMVDLGFGERHEAPQFFSHACCRVPLDRSTYAANRFMSAAAT